MSPKKDTQKATAFTDEEKAAMKARAKELKAEARASKDKAAGESAVLAAIAEMSESERAMVDRLHALIKESAPALSPKTWYGMPAYANAEGSISVWGRDKDSMPKRIESMRKNSGANGH